ncbi:MAG: class I SAM-dependent methyltransferase, partial [Deltaproteobacteria bacterium]|nr:class I SAM-dependent methyltransferase [Deltaproteobacteria bacterium]
MWSTTRGEKELLSATVRAIDAPRVLEIGAFRGETTCVLAEAAAARGGYVVVIDPMRWTAEVSNNGLARHLPEALASRVRSLSSWLDRASYEHAFWRALGPRGSSVRLHRALSTAPELLTSAHPDLGEFDVVFIDGDHGHAGAWNDLSRWATRTVRGGAILVHDAVPRFPGVLRALEDFQRAHDVVVDLPNEDSLAFIRVRRAFAGEPALGSALAGARTAGAWLE